jgi:hypothetical protein
MPTVNGTHWEEQVRFGLRSYALQPFVSANGNARTVVTNVNTASTKTDRVLANVKLGQSLGKIYDSLGIVTKDSFVNIDHSDMNGLMVLAGAVQTSKGRAVPCLIETTYSDRLPAGTDVPPRKQALRKARAEERKTIGLTAHTMRSLQQMADRLGFWPKFVFDRGFGSKEIIRLLYKANSAFYIRAKAGRIIETEDATRIKLKEMTGNDERITIGGMKLRVVRSEDDGKNDEPWYILTNDMGSASEKVIDIYYYRFEIEETFKDIKHVWEMRRTRLNSPNSLKIILWFVSIGLALLYLAGEASQAYSLEQLRHPKKRRSWPRIVTELLGSIQVELLWNMPLYWLQTETRL